MYGIFAYIYHRNQPNVGKYTIHGSYGIASYRSPEGSYAVISSRALKRVLHSQRNNVGPLVV